MDPGVMVVLATLGFVVVVVVGAMAIDLRREARARAQTRDAQANLPTRSHAQLAGPCGRVGQPHDAVAASHPPDLAATATHERRAS